MIKAAATTTFLLLLSTIYTTKAAECTEDNLIDATQIFSAAGITEKFRECTPKWDDNDLEKSCELSSCLDYIDACRDIATRLPDCTTESGINLNDQRACRLAQSYSRSCGLGEFVDADGNTIGSTGDSQDNEGIVNDVKPLRIFLSLLMTAFMAAIL